MARRGVPNLIESTIVPAILFFVLVTTIGAAIAMAAVLVWAYGAILRRVLRGDRIPAILVLATLGLTVRTLVGPDQREHVRVLRAADRDDGRAGDGVPGLGA